MNAGMILAGFMLMLFAIGFLPPVGLEFFYTSPAQAAGQAGDYLTLDAPQALIQNGYPAKLRVDRAWFYSTYGLAIGNFTRDIVRNGQLYDPRLGEIVSREQADSWVIGRGPEKNTPQVAMQRIDVNWPKLSVFLMGLTLIFAGLASGGGGGSRIRAGEYEMREVGGLG
jgi:hypothetical protein